MSLQSFLIRATGYYPTPPEIADTPEGRMEGGPVDRKGRPLCTLQDYLSGKVPYVSVAMDQFLKIQYGTVLWIPSFDAKYQKPVIFRVVDCGNAFKNKGWTRMDICVANRLASLDRFLNDNHLVYPLILDLKKAVP